MNLFTLFNASRASFTAAALVAGSHARLALSASSSRRILARAASEQDFLAAAQAFQHGGYTGSEAFGGPHPFSQFRCSAAHCHPSKVAALAIDMEMRQSKQQAAVLQMRKIMPCHPN
ncbi:hypothetical protein NKH70_22875 [Mesorhizobium sp. M0991]|uniref:hypothetical protein n=1 Tax=Mesorhizobium sp. M0991 TaxID=2957043 RepID=UPI00333A790A